MKQKLEELCEKVLEVKKIQVAIGAHKKPKDKEDVIIFHIDF
jgi:hypothetical protein